MHSKRLYSHFFLMTIFGNPRTRSPQFLTRYFALCVDEKCNNDLILYIRFYKLDAYQSECWHAFGKIDLWQLNVSTIL